MTHYVDENGYVRVRPTTEKDRYYSYLKWLYNKGVNCLTMNLEEEFDLSHVEAKRIVKEWNKINLYEGNDE